MKNGSSLLGMYEKRSTQFYTESVATKHLALSSKGNDANSSWQQWIHQPQRLWLHSVLFNVHYMVGVVLGVYIGLMSLTGAILVYRDELSGWIPVEWLVRLHSDLLAGNHQVCGAPRARSSGYHSTCRAHHSCKGFDPKPAE